MTHKTAALLGFAAKAGKLSYGMFAAVTSAKTGKAKLLLCCRDVSEKSRKEINHFADKFNIKTMTLDESMDNMPAVIGRRCGILSVNDIGFRDSLTQEEKQ